MANQEEIISEPGNKGSVLLNGMIVYISPIQYNTSDNIVVMIMLQPKNDIPHTCSHN